MKQGYDLIVKNEGFKYLFKGFSTTVMGIFVLLKNRFICSLWFIFLAYEYMNSYAIKITKGL